MLAQWFTGGRLKHGPAVRLCSQKDWPSFSACFRAPLPPTTTNNHTFLASVLHTSCSQIIQRLNILGSRMTMPTRVRCLDPPGPPSMAPGAPAYVSYPSFNAGAAPSYPPYGAPPPGAMQYPAPGQMPAYGYPPQPGPCGPPHVSFECSADARRQVIVFLGGRLSSPCEQQAGVLFPASHCCGCGGQFRGASTHMMSPDAWHAGA